MAIFTLVIYTVSGTQRILDAHDLDARSSCVNSSSFSGYRIGWCINYQAIFIISTFVRKHFSRSHCGNELNRNYVYTLKESLGVVGATGLSLVLSFFITLIEVLVAFLQAYIFTMLSALFIGMAVAEHDHDHKHDKKGHAVPDAEDVRADFI